VINIKMCKDFCITHGLCVKCQRAKTEYNSMCICGDAGSSSNNNKRKFGEPGKAKKAMAKFKNM
jgi:hypothetical protein